MVSAGFATLGGLAAALLKHSDSSAQGPLQPRCILRVCTRMLLAALVAGASPMHPLAALILGAAIMLATWPTAEHSFSPPSPLAGPNFRPDDEPRRASVFLAYAHTDSAFVDRLDEGLARNGIQTWRDIRDAEAGPLESVIHAAIHRHETVVVVLSRASVENGWVEWEIATALELAQKLDRDVICPVALDDAWLTRLSPPIREKLKRYGVLDFSSPVSFELQLRRLVVGLRLHYFPLAS